MYGAKINVCFDYDVVLFSILCHPASSFKDQFTSSLEDLGWRARRTPPMGPNSFVFGGPRPP